MEVVLKVGCVIIKLDFCFSFNTRIKDCVNIKDSNTPR